MFLVFLELWGFGLSNKASEGCLFSEAILTKSLVRKIPLAHALWNKHKHSEFKIHLEASFMA